MRIDGRAIPAGETIEADVCIIGAGAAGITLALELLNSDVRVCLLEAGGYQLDERTQSLYRGELSGGPYWPLAESRLRFFGGTTNHWTGWCRTLAPIDFEKRDWVAESGWPIAYDEMARYYGRARPILELPPPAPPGSPKPGWEPIAFPSGRIRTDTVYFSPPTRFGVVYRKRIEQAPNVKLILHANVTRIQRASGEARITHVRATSFEGNPFHVRARIFILATGGIENARLLLASNDVETTGLGNRHGVVGRYFMDHGLLRPYGRCVLSASRGYLLYAGDAKHRGLLALSDEAQRREKILGFACRLRLTQPVRRSQAGPSVETDSTGGEEGGLLEHIRNLFANDVDRPVPRPHGGQPRGAVHAILNPIGEQEPHPENRVTLTAERDELGMPRARLHRTLSERDLNTLRRGLEIVAHEIGRLGLGRVQLPPWAEDRSSSWFGLAGTHHLGSTRMSADPKRGVVDGSCRVHGLANLYVAGSSVFPTSGTANPTMTLVALAVRLADEVKRELA